MRRSYDTLICPVNMVYVNNPVSFVLPVQAILIIRAAMYRNCPDQALATGQYVEPEPAH